MIEPDIKLNPETMIERTQAGEWDDDPVYRAAYQKYILRPQSDDFLLANNLRAYRKTETPFDERPRVEALVESFTQAIISGETTAAYAYRLVRANKRETGEDELKWEITLKGLIVLAVKELRVNYGWRRIDPAKLRKAIQNWESQNERATASDDGNWSRDMNLPEIVALLAAYVPTTISGYR